MTIYQRHPACRPPTPGMTVLVGHDAEGDYIEFDGERPEIMWTTTPSIESQAYGETTCEPTPVILIQDSTGQVYAYNTLTDEPCWDDDSNAYNFYAYPQDYYEDKADANAEWLRHLRAQAANAQERLEKWERLLAEPPAPESPIAAFADVILAETGD